ncbi:MAG: hypothetical protein ACYDAK_07550 [Candidatus Limnocylindrales bacterium]
MSSESPVLPVAVAPAMTSSGGADVGATAGDALAPAAVRSV